MKREYKNSPLSALSTKAKRLLALTALTLCFALQAVGQTYTLSPVSAETLGGIKNVYNTSIVAPAAGESLTLNVSGLYSILNNYGSETKSFYMRAFIKDKNSSAITPVSSLTSWGLAFSNNNSWVDTFQNFGTNGAAILNSNWETSWSAPTNITITGTIPESATVADYQLVVLLSYYRDPWGNGASSTNYVSASQQDNNYTITENSIVALAVYDFVTEEELLKNYKFPDLSESSSINVHQYSMTYNAGETSIVLDPYDYYALITSDYGGASWHNLLNTTVYMHIYFLDKDGNPIQTDGTYSNTTVAYNTDSHIGEEHRPYLYSGNGFYAYSTNPSGYAYLFHTDWGNQHPNQSQFTITAPTGMSLSDFKVVMVLSNDVSGFSVSGSNVLTNPTNMKTSLVFDFTTPGFRHYEGYANAEGEWDTTTGNNMQLTHEWTYNKYVEPGSTIRLELPIQQERGLDLEPHGYFRWYNYNTDQASANLSTTTYGQKLVSLNDADDSSINRGLFQWNIWGVGLTGVTGYHATFANVAAIDYVAPAGGWTGETIACDVSRYLDGLDASKTQLIHEPTLSTRYIYRIRPASELATAIMNAITTTAEAVYENNGYYSLCTDAGVGASSSAVASNLRLNLQNVSDYYFYPYSKCDDQNANPQESDFNTGTLCKATKVLWRAFNAAGTHYKDLETNSNRMCALSLNALNNNNSWAWRKVGEPANELAEADRPRDFQTGDMIYVIAYLVDDTNNRCPVARFNVRFYANSAPMQYDDPALPDHRKIEYLERYYNRVAVIDFDDDAYDATLRQPTNPLDNMTGHPSAWDRRNYGFVYKDLYDYYDYTANGGGVYVGLSCNHGDYGLYKSFNVTGVSQSETDIDGYRYLWWYTGAPVYDRTYAMTNGSQSGYFLYVDASDESRQIASVTFDGELCAGSTVVISAAVNDLTSGQTKPQLLYRLYGIEEDAEGNITRRSLIQSFGSSNFVTYSPAPSAGSWYQVYIRTTLQHGTGVENFTKFLVVVDNYCKGTDGADYAVDDIRIYTRNASVEVAQTSIPCDASQVTTATVKVKIPQEALVSWLDSENNWILYPDNDQQPYYKYFYYRVCDSDGNPVPGVTYDVVNKLGEANTTSTEWGRARVFRVYRNKPADVDDAYYEYDELNELYFVIDEDLVLPFEDGKRYYVSLIWPTLGSGGGGADEETAQLTGPNASTAWGTPTDICSAYSEILTVVKQEPAIYDSDGELLSDITLQCDGSTSAFPLTAQLTIPDPINGGTMTVDDVTFDWYIIVNGTKTQDSPVATDVATYSYTYNAAHVSDDGKIHFQLVTKTTEVTITSATGESVTMDLCADPMDVAFNVETNGPKLMLGFPDVVYVADSYRNVRLGMAQLTDMKTNGKMLVLPVNSYSHMSDQTTGFHLAMASGNDQVMVSDTNDPTWASVTDRAIGKVVSLSADQVVIELASDYTAADFHEGYEYEMHFQFVDSEYESSHQGQNPCYGDVYFTTKVVPEYVTWTGAANSGWSTNWNNDENWTRSLGETLYKTDYTDYGTGDYATLTPQQTYVPMKFTKVTIPANIQAPRLRQLTSTSSGIIHGGLTSESNYYATTDIEYDLMVKIADELTTDYNSDSKADYDCEKWYGNTCKEIYFKPMAELRYQEYLTYERAWMEYEFKANKWQLIAAPLKNVYAGDMYVPYAKGRQETEAFVDIKYDETQGYSRTRYPIYQRSWDATSSKVVTADGKDYVADIDYTSWDDAESDVMLNQWSHTYNDVTVGLTPAGNNNYGFSLRAHRVNRTDNALIRLPKADTSYDYSSYTGTSSVTDQVTKEEGNKANLLADNTTGTNAPITMTLHNDDSSNDIFLVSNPYMASLNMNAFFEANADVIGDSRKFWTIAEGEVKSSPNASGTLATIAPGQAFFIKVAGGKGKTVRFTTNMLTNQKVDYDGKLITNVGKLTENAVAMQAAKAVKMTAVYGSKQSTAIVMLRDEATEEFDDIEDVETLYDSNLADVPTVYTVASNQTVSFNALPMLTVVPMGIVCDSDVETDVTFTGISKMDGDVYLYDCATGENTLLEDSLTMTLKANDHGRYYLTSRTITSGLHDVAYDYGVRCYSPAPGILTVTCLAGSDRIESIELYTIDGKRLMSLRDLNSQSINLNTYKGIKLVVVKHTGSDEPETCKVAVK